jgi:hypothetical protein
VDYNQNRKGKIMFQSSSKLDDSAQEVSSIAYTSAFDY